MARKRYNCFGMKKENGEWICSILSVTECAHSPCPFYKSRTKYMRERKLYRQKELEYLRKRRNQSYE